MKYSAVAVAAFVAIASAQDISIIPECALPCIDKAALKVCNSKEDFKCICENKESLVGAATTCVIGACGAEVALQEVLPATETFCEEVLAGGDAPASSAAATTAAPATSSAAAAPSSSAAAVTTSAAAVESSAAATTLAPSASVPAPSSNGTVSVAPPVSSSPVEAGAAVAGYIGSFGVAALAALAAF